MLIAMTLLTVGSVRAQPNMTAALVGKWAGDVEMAAGTYPRTLVIKSVEPRGRQRAVEAEYGGPGNEYGIQSAALAPVEGVAYMAGEAVVVSFRTAEGWRVELTLQKGGKYLLGALLLPVTGKSPSRADNPMRLKKVE